MVGEAMCLYDGGQWCSVCGGEEGSKRTDPWGTPVTNLCSVDISPPKPTSKDDQWVKPAKWNPSDDYERVDRTQEDLMIECQKWQTDPADI